jgi:hypothetical protein
MKRSGQVLLTAAFTASIAIYAAQAQQAKHSTGNEDRTNQSARDTVHHHSKGFLGLFRRNSAPKTTNQGFGNTVVAGHLTGHS